MIITHKTIIDHLKKKLERDPFVYALWLEGSLSLDINDPYSDIDVVADVKDGKEQYILKKIKTLLQYLAPLDYESEKNIPTEGLIHQTFHLKGTSPHLLIDIDVQSHSRKFFFVKDHPFEKPLVLFDKKGVIQFKPGSISKEEMKNLVKQLESQFVQSTKVEKYIVRKKFLEAFAYYHHYILQPLVELFRLEYLSQSHGYGLVKIYDSIPRAVLVKLEYLHKISSLKDIEHKTKKAQMLFKETLKRI